MVVKTVSGSVASWPATGNVTTRPLPVLDTIQTIYDDQTEETLIVWQPNPDSYQDGYKVGQYLYIALLGICYLIPTRNCIMLYVGGCKRIVFIFAEIAKIYNP